MYLSIYGNSGFLILSSAATIIDQEVSTTLTSYHSEVTDDVLSAVMSGSHIPSSASDTGLPGGL